MTSKDFNLFEINKKEKTILIVDDDAINIYSLEQLILSLDENIKIDTATNGQEAVEIV